MVKIVCFILCDFCCCSVAKSCPTLCDPMGFSIPGSPSPSLSPGVYSNSCPLSQWCHPNISSCVAPSPAFNLFPASGSFPVRELLTSGGQRIKASVKVLPRNIQDWFPLGLTSLIALLSKGLSGVFSSTTVWKHQFFSTQASLWFNSHIHTWLLEKPKLWLYDFGVLAREDERTSF